MVLASVTGPGGGFTLRYYEFLVTAAGDRRELSGETAAVQSGTR